MADVEDWIRADLAAFPPRAKSLVITVWGDAIVPHGGRVWLSGLIRLMQPLGCNERLVRTSIFRLANEGWLAARQVGRRSQYRLTADGKRRFEHAYQRVYGTSQQTWDGRWDIVLLAAEDAQGNARRAARESLAWEGFAMLAPGVFARPRQDTADGTAAAVVQSLKLSSATTIMVANEPVTSRGSALKKTVQQNWDLAAIDAEYRGFIARFRPVIQRFTRVGEASLEQSFVVRTLLIHAYRRVTLHDP